MRKVLLAIAVLMVPMSVSAQITDCPNCVLGIYDDQGLSKNFGIWDQDLTGPLKSVFVGIKYDPLLIEQLSGLTSIELSVDGIPAGPFGPPAFKGIPDPTVTIGTDIRTPDDEVTGTGGVNMAWNSCLPGDRAVVQIDMLSLSAIPMDIVLRVRRKFPPSSPSIQQQLITQCDAPIFTATTVSGGCYVINPTVPPGGTVDGCELDLVDAVEAQTWGKVKALYKD